MKSIPVNLSRLEASICRESFFDFFQRFWDVVVPETLVLNWHLKYLCGELQEIAERVLQRRPSKGNLIINISPGTTKSTICSVMFPAWCWTRDPTLRLICGSYSYHLSLYLARLCRNVLTSDKYQKLFPEIQLVEEQKEMMINTRGGQRIATSTGGSITGMHGHILVVDDPINPREAVSPVMVKAANDWIDQTLMTRKIDRRITPLVLIMQRLHQADPTGHLVGKGNGVRHVCLPAEDAGEVKPSSLRRFYRRGLMDPRRLGRVALASARKDLGEYGYAGQFLQSPVPLAGGMFRIEHIRLVPAFSGLTQVVRYWDKAGTRDAGAYTVGLKMGVNGEGRFCVLDVVRGRWEASEREKIIRLTAEMDGKKIIVGVEQEPGSGGKESAQATVRSLAGFRVRIDRPVGDKVLRADPFAVQVNGGNVDMVQAGWNREYFEEMQFFPSSRYKDQIDASSGAFAMMTTKRIVLGVF